MTKRFYASHLELILSQKGCLIIQALFGRLINGRYKDTPGPLNVALVPFLYTYSPYMPARISVPI